MKGHIWRRLALVAALTAALLSGTPSSRAAESIFSLPDMHGDAHAATSLCSVECGGAPTPVSEPSVDARRVRLDRVGGDLVVEWKVVDLDHVPVIAQPDDIVGYQIGFEVAGVRPWIVAWRTAAHAPLESFVAVGNSPDEARRPIAVSFDHAADTVRATIPLPVLNDAVDDVCGSCHVDNGSVYGSPFVMTFVLATTPGGPTGPMYQDIVRETTFVGPVVPTEEGLPTWYFGGGPFTGTVDYDPASTACGEWSMPVTMTLDMNVALSKGTGHYVGPLRLEASGCGSGLGNGIFDRASMRGTDLQGRTLHCPELGGMIVNVMWWGGSFGGECTLDGTALHVNPVPWGEFVPTGVGTSGTTVTIPSGAVAGAFTISAYERHTP